MPKQNRGPYILAAGAAAQLLTGIPAAWGVFQQPVMQGYGFSRGQAMLAFAVLVAAYGVGCAVGGLLQDARGPRFAGLWGTALLAGGFFAAALVPPANAALFLVVYSVPAGLGSAFLAPAVLACAQKWYQDKKGWATGVAGVAMGLSGAFFTVFVRGVGGAWGIRVCFAALGAVMLVVCGAGALILQDPPPKAQSAPPQPGLDYKQMLRTPQYKLCAAAVALSAPAVLLFSPEIFKIAAERGLPESVTSFRAAFTSASVSLPLPLKFLKTFCNLSAKLSNAMKTLPLTYSFPISSEIASILSIRDRSPSFLYWPASSLISSTIFFVWLNFSTSFSFSSYPERILSQRFTKSCTPCLLIPCSSAISLRDMSLNTTSSYTRRWCSVKSSP